MESITTTPRDDRFYTPRANSFSLHSTVSCSSEDGEFFTPRTVRNGSKCVNDSSTLNTARSNKSDNSDLWQTPRSARLNAAPDDSHNGCFSRESSSAHTSNNSSFYLPTPYNGGGSSNSSPRYVPNQIQKTYDYSDYPVADSEEDVSHLPYPQHVEKKSYNNSPRTGFNRNSSRVQHNRSFSNNSNTSSHAPQNVHSMRDHRESPPQYPIPQHWKHQKRPQHSFNYGGVAHEEKDPYDFGGEIEEDMELLGVEDTITSNDVEDIFRYARHGRGEEMEKLLDAGIPVNVRDEYGSTLLIIACQNGNKKIAKSVLRRGANINSRNFKGNTALHYCYQCKRMHLLLCSM